MFLFSLVMSISPGPVNMVILSSGINYGIKKTMPYVSGATIGFTILLLCVGLVFEKIIKINPYFFTYLSLAGTLYIIYIGYKIASSKPKIEISKNDVPKFYEGFLLQWLNPKAWIACMSGASLFSSVISNRPFLTFTGIYFIVCYASLALWAIVGERISYLLNSERRIHLFNISMGMVLILLAVYLFFSQSIS